jgi:hypothetical protein
MNHLSRRAFIIAASMAPQAGALEIAAQNRPVPNDGARKSFLLPAHPEAAGGPPAAEQMANPAAEVLTRFRHMPEFRKELGWKLAYTQHSMYMFIDEDRGEPRVGERTSPWGAPDASIYVERIRRNLASLDKIPGLMLSYDFPGVDIELIAQEFPDALEQMQRMHKRGVFDFVNGTYSGAHLQILSSESNWRQFEYGLEVFQRLFGKKMNTFAFQENGLHQQLPQILKHFGYEMISAPGGFPWAMEIIDGPFEIESSHNGTNFLREEEFVWAEALDGTRLPFYLVQPVQGSFYGDWNLKRAMEAGFEGPPPVWLYCPDMEEVDQTNCESMAELFDFVLLETELLKRVREAPPHAKARIFSYWSYAEGVWAEELLRSIRAAEYAALMAEAVQAMGKQAGSSIDRTEDLREIWRTIIKYQCHDVMWIETTDLRRKGIDRDNECAVKCSAIVSEIAGHLVGGERNAISVFNGLPWARRALIEVENEEVPGGGPAFQEFEGKVFGVRELPPGGFRSFPIAASATPSKEIPLPPKITTAHYSVELANGLISQITTEEGKGLLSAANYLGGELRAKIHDKWVDNRSADCQFFDGEVCYILTRAFVLGDIPVKERYFFFRNENFIKAELEFDFQGNEVGNFWMDETKLNVYYPTCGHEIHYDIPFGYVAGRAHRVLFAANWLSCGGLVYVNWGTVKHWVRNGVIANVLAWGGNTFDNRIDFDFWVSKQQYDLKLYGKQTIKYALIPLAEFDGNRIVRAVEDLTTPVFVTKGGGEKSFYEIRNQDLAVTAVFEKQGKLWARGYDLPSSNEDGMRGFEIFNSPIEELT